MWPEILNHNTGDFQQMTPSFLSLHPSELARYRSKTDPSNCKFTHLAFKGGIVTAEAATASVSDPPTTMVLSHCQYFHTDTDNNSDDDNNREYCASSTVEVGEEGVVMDLTFNFFPAPVPATVVLAIPVIIHFHLGFLHPIAVRAQIKGFLAAHFHTRDMITRTTVGPLYCNLMTGRINNFVEMEGSI